MARVPIGTSILAHFSIGCAAAGLRKRLTGNRHPAHDYAIRQRASAYVVAVKNSTGNAQRNFHKRQAEKGGGEGIELLRVRVRILMGKQMLSGFDGPAEISRALMKMIQQEPAVDSAGDSDDGGAWRHHRDHSAQVGQLSDADGS